MSDPTETLKLLGIESTDELRKKVIDRLVHELVGHVTYEDDGALFDEVSRKANELVRSAVNAKVQALGDEHVNPIIDRMIDGIVLQETNRWGEKVGESKTFVEYLVERADAYMTEPVNWSGQTKEEARKKGDRWTGEAPRLTHAIDRMLANSIEKAMQTIIADANKVLEEGLRTAVEIKLREVVQKVQVGLKR